VYGICVANAVVGQLADCTVLDPTGKELRLGAFWDQRPVILAMIRHFG